MYPDVLCIGAQKAGTSWLYAALEEQPGVWLPPGVKELHYWNLPTHLPTAALTAHRGRFRIHMTRLMEARRDGRTDDAAWLKRYLFLPRTDSWYGRLFEPPGGRLGVDVTPAYARLPDKTVARIAQRMPDARVIFLLRNPVHRIWSQVRMILGRRGRLEGRTDRSLRRVFEREDCVLGSDYIRTLDIWERHFGEDRVHVGFLEHIGEDPAGFLDEILTFLELKQTAVELSSELHAPRNVNPSFAIPPDAARYLAERWLPQAVAVHRRFDNRWTAAWVEELEAATT